MKKKSLTASEPMRLQKYLADLGLGSRRQVEEWIKAGRIKVNGNCAILGMRVSTRDHIQLDGKEVRKRADARESVRVLCYHKPEGKMCTRFDPQGRPTVFEDLPRLSQGRWIQVGRLDLNTSGLILFTDFGELAHRLMHPKYEIEREYAVRVLGDVQESQLRAMKKGVEIAPGQYARFDSIDFEGGDGANKWYRVVLKEGQNREVRRIWETQNLMVSRLIRVRYADVTLPRLLPRGRYQELDEAATEALLTQVQLEATLFSESPSRGAQHVRFASFNKKSPDRRVVPDTRPGSDTGGNPRTGRPKSRHGKVLRHQQSREK